MSRDYDVTQRAGAGERWVCAACGRHSEPGGARIDLGDTSCVIAAVLCKAERDEDGMWITVVDWPAVIRFTSESI